MQMGGDKDWESIDDMLSRADEGLVEKARVLASSGRFIVISSRPEIIVYLGEMEDHVVVDRSYCSCRGFMMRLGRPGGSGCSHVLAVRMGLRRVRSVNVGGLVGRIVWEVLTGGYTRTLRELIVKEWRS